MSATENKKAELIPLNLKFEGQPIHLKFKAKEEEIALLCAYLTDLADAEKATMVLKINAAKKNAQKAMLEKINFEIAIKALDSAIKVCPNEEIKTAACKVKDEALALGNNPKAKTNFSKLTEFVRETTKVVEGDQKAINTYQKKINDFKGNGTRNARICYCASLLLYVVSVTICIAAAVLLSSASMGIGIVLAGLGLTVLAVSGQFYGQALSNRDKLHKPTLTAGNKLFALFPSGKNILTTSTTVKPLQLNKAAGL